MESGKKIYPTQKRKIECSFQSFVYYYLVGCADEFGSTTPRMNKHLNNQRWLTYFIKTECKTEMHHLRNQRHSGPGVLEPLGVRPREASRQLLPSSSNHWSKKGWIWVDCCRILLKLHFISEKPPILKL